jgi:hypothetical protein
MNAQQMPFWRGFRIGCESSSSPPEYRKSGRLVLRARSPRCEGDAHKKATSDEMASYLGLYVTRWQRWAAAGLTGITIELYGDVQNLNLTGPIQIEQW